MRPDDRALSRGFARRMLPLALLVALLVAALPTAWWYTRVTQRALTSASAWSRHVAGEVAEDALASPRVWSYRLGKSVPTAIAGVAAQDVSAVQVVGCDGRVLYAHGRPEGVIGSAPVRARGRVLARVRVSVKKEREGGVGALTGALALGLSLGVLVFWFPLAVVRRQERALALARAALERANASLLERVDEAVESLRRTSARLVTIQDEERARLSRELHDGVGQTLTALKVELERARGPGELARVERALELCEETMRELRVSIEDLRPMALRDATLEQVLAAACERFELRTGVAVYLRARVERALEPAHEAAMLRVFQEAMHNVERHAEASEVGVALVVGEQGASLSVEDDGVGFDPEAGGGGHGLGNMRTRAELLGGAVVIESSPGDGTVVRFALES